MQKKNKSDIIFSTPAQELEFYNGRLSFLAIEINVGNSDLDSHLFNEFLWIVIKKN